MNNLLSAACALLLCVAGALMIAVIGSVIMCANFGDEWGEIEDEI